MKTLMIAFCCLALAACSGSMHLTDLERSKLDPVLARLFEGNAVNDSDYETNFRSDGEKEYGVIIRSDNVDEIKAAGIRVGSATGDVITARVTIVELRKVLGISSVRAVQNSTRSYPQ